MALGFGVGAEEAEQCSRRTRRACTTSSGPSARQPPSPSSRTAGCGCRRGRCPRSGSDQPWHQMSLARRHARQAALPSARRCRTRRSSAPRRKMPFWFTRCGAPARVVLLLEDEPSHEVGAATAVLDRPRRPRPSRRRRTCAPIAGAARSRRAVSIDAERLDAGRWPRATRARLTPEGVLLGGVPEVHLRRTLGEPIGHRQVPRRPSA